ncbi:hypothetical protein [uncultured Chitinophaga sp.]|uniref:hypothetical protein n=1 Tax=uncultured Chitinophaga sp. TaxID=339340 RepID=UPI002635CE1B|nr:hypothetical protein [uncultured Chitinophaga sp.]
MPIILLSLSFWDRSILKKMEPGSKTFLIVPVEMIRSHTTAPAVEFFKFLYADPLRFRASVMLTFEGYDDDPREVCDLPEVRRFMHSVVQACPELLFFMNQDPITGAPDFEHLFMLVVDSTPLFDGSGLSMYGIDLEASGAFFERSLTGIKAMLETLPLSALTIAEMLGALRRRYLETFRQP